ncbi:hypothetical protein GM661_12420 [Iocasia frigidifontis]|uniref:DUF4829 domain-containing protein n=1 Tax=Iocasia fonsfrigidae TaxID=2682810 RepID=A0A8A7KA85_9FIRM|nr:hypothetical protein [Iocasia fonsfrigidae]QTL98713.1 hypothetical protein GM661_12420 [Iocasia fonsfrigidae]
MGLSRERVILIINIIVFLLVIPVFSTIASAIENKEIADFVTEVYQVYMAKDFDAVYKYLHPDIKGIMSDEDYINFQEETSNKHKMSISQVRVKGVKSLDKIPGEFEEYLSKTDEQDYYSVSISYLLSYYLGKEREREVEKDVYLCLEGDNLYFLWDPAAIE